MVQERYSPPAGPPPSRRDWANSGTGSRPADPADPPSYTAGWAQRQPGSDSHHVTFATGPELPDHAGSTSNYPPPPSGPPPNYHSSNEDSITYSAAQASHNRPEASTYQSLQEQPPYESEATALRPEHDWTVVPDTSLLPPPPSIWHKQSPIANASDEDAQRAESWCRQNPLWQPIRLAPEIHQLVQAGRITLLRPPEFVGEILPNKQIQGLSKVRSASNCRDTSLLTSLPLYSAYADSPYLTGQPKAIYYEVRILALGGRDLASRFQLHHHNEPPSLALGFTAPPYPTWRLPGWQRGSLGVHGDDGHRFVNDSCGGAEFTQPFQPGETVGLGILFKQPPNMPPAYPGEGGRPPNEPLDVEVFFTRNGTRVGSWDIHEELDAERADESPDGVTGLEGKNDIFAAVGISQGVEFEVLFRRDQWKYRAV